MNPEISLTMMSVNTTTTAIPDRNPASVVICKDCQRRRNVTCRRERTTHCQANGLAAREAVQRRMCRCEGLVCWRAFRHGSVAEIVLWVHSSRSPLLIRSTLIERGEGTRKHCTDGRVGFTVCRVFICDMDRGADPDTAGLSELSAVQELLASESPVSLVLHHIPAAAGPWGQRCAMRASEDLANRLTLRALVQKLKAGQKRASGACS
jgi:hypothetical protein